LSIERQKDMFFLRGIKMEATDWLDKAKEKLKIDSDYKLAKIIGIGNAAIANIRRRKSGMDNYVASRLEDMLELEKMTVIIDMEIQKAKSEEKKKYWQKKEQIYLTKK
jgi:ribosome-binding protein aMBF1 (putative translation factor)